MRWNVKVSTEIGKLLPNQNCPFCQADLTTPEDWGMISAVGDTAPLQCPCERKFHVANTIITKAEYDPLDTIYFHIIPDQVFIKSNREIKEVATRHSDKLRIEVPLNIIDLSDPDKLIQRFKDLIIFI